MSVRKLTTKWLIKEGGCEKGVKWFKRNYPNGMTFTKKNINKLVDKLFRMRKPLPNTVGCNMNWILMALGKRTFYISNIHWRIASREEIADAFWEDYSNG